MNRLTRTALLVAALALASTLAGTALAATWNMATPYPDATFHTQNDRWLADTIKQATDGQLEIRVHSNGSLVKHAQIKPATQTGQVQMGEVIISLLANDSPIYAADSIPFLATTYEQARALWQAQRPVVDKMLSQQGLKLLYAEPWPAQGLYTKERVDSMDDMQGVKFRAYNAETAKLARAMGGTPTQVEVPALPQAFSTGIVDAMMTSPSTGVNTQAWDYVNYYYPVNAWIPKNMVFVNKRAFESLPEAQQQAVLDAAREAKKRGWQMARDEAKSKTAELKKHGIKVVQASDTLQDEFTEIGKQLTRAWLDSGGDQVKQIVDAYHDNLDSSGGE